MYLVQVDVKVILPHTAGIYVYLRIFGMGGVKGESRTTAYQPLQSLTSLRENIRR